MTAPSLAERLTPAVRRRITIGAWLVATVLVVAAFYAIGWRKTLEALSRAHGGWLLVAVLANLAIIALWAWQSIIFLPPGRHVGFSRMFEVQALTTTATNTAPAFFGEAAGIAALAERGGVGAAVALSVFAQHHMVEGIAKVVVLLVAAHAAPLPAWMDRSLIGLTIAVGTLVVVLYVVAAIAARRPDQQVPTGASRAARLRAAVIHWANGLVALRSPGRFALGLAIALAMKAAEAFGWFAVQQAFGVTLGLRAPVLALTAVNLASALSATPGNIGVYEGAAFLVYRSFDLTHDLALAISVTGHLCYLLPLVGAGYVILTVRQLRGRRDSSS